MENSPLHNEIMRAIGRLEGKVDGMNEKIDSLNKVIDTQQIKIDEHQSFIDTITAKMTVVASIVAFFGAALFEWIKNRITLG